MHKNLYDESIIMKISIADQSACQEVDNAHSAIENHMKINEFYSPVGFLGLLKTVNHKNPYTSIQMQKDYCKNYSEVSKKLEY